MAILPFGAVARDLNAGRISARRIVEPDISCDLNLIYRRDKPPSKVGFAIIDHIEQSLEEVAARGGHRGQIQSCR